MPCLFAALFFYQVEAKDENDRERGDDFSFC
jgi:hypothetical protein